MNVEHSPKILTHKENVTTAIIYSNYRFCCRLGSLRTVLPASSLVCTSNQQLLTSDINSSAYTVAFVFFLRLMRACSSLAKHQRLFIRQGVIEHLTVFDSLLIRSDPTNHHS